MRFVFLAVSGLTLVLAGAASGQRAQKTPAPPPVPAVDAAAAVFRSPAWAEIALRKAELSAELESLLAEYTEEYPKIKEIRHTLETLKAERARLLKVKAADAERLTPALGRLIVRKTELEAEYWRLLQSYKDEHPDVKRAKKKVDAFETSIREILGQ
jgi:uncharacterized protein involved in exopolysaccharide biosynthesis